MHVHVCSERGEAKFWLKPTIDRLVLPS
ncbi:MAG: hypothetical protein JSR31_10355 [Nitrospira sp.]|nr:hypothetical protein [Nitrospira sp.]